MTILRPFFLIGSLLLVASSAQLGAASAMVVLTPGVPVVVPSDTPASVRRAVEDLRRDLQKVLGAPSPVVTDVAALSGRSGIVISRPGAGEWHHAGVTGREAHGIHVRESGGASHVILEGADPRGSIYAIYSFADEFLDVPPLWYWAEWSPAPRESLVLPGDTERIFPPAYVRWRAWFNNDTDYLTPWRGRSAANNEAIYETILRLKYNTYEVGSVADFSAGAPRHAVHRDPAGAHARGLAITHHHTSPLGSSLRNWDSFWRLEGREPPALSVRDEASLIEFWRYHAETARRAGFEQVWTIVFRGAGDIPYWQTIKDGPEDTAARARIIGDMLRAQVAMVKEVSGEPAPPMRTTLYNEGSTMFAAGLLRPPAEPTLIWNFVAARRDHFPADDVRGFRAPPGRMVGYYLNFQFNSTGSHLAAAEGPWKMAANYRTVDGIGTEPLTFTVVNAGNIREHLTELSANADMMWRFKEFDADDFLRRFCRRYYGPEPAADVAAAYRDFYHAYWTQKPADIPGFERQYLFQDLRYARAVEMLLKDMAAGIDRPNPLHGHPQDNPDTGSVGYFRVEPQPGDRNQLDAMRRGTSAARARFAAVAARIEALRPRIAPAGRVYFHDNLAAQAQLMVHLNTMLHESVLAYEAGARPDVKRRHLAAALQALESVQAALDSTRHGTFEQWYAGDRVFKLAGLRESLTAAAGSIRP